jgi:hypothetical protein
MEKQFKVLKKFLKESKLNFSVDNFSAIHFHGNNILLVFKDFNEACDINEKFILTEKFRDAIFFEKTIIKFSFISPKMIQL